MQKYRTNVKPIDSFYLASLAVLGGAYDVTVNRKGDSIHEVVFQSMPDTHDKIMRQFVPRKEKMILGKVNTESGSYHSYCV